MLKDASTQSQQSNTQVNSTNATPTRVSEVVIGKYWMWYQDYLPQYSSCSKV